MKEFFLTFLALSVIATTFFSNPETTYSDNDVHVERTTVGESDHSGKKDPDDE